MTILTVIVHLLKYLIWRTILQITVMFHAFVGKIPKNTFLFFLTHCPGVQTSQNLDFFKELEFLGSMRLEKKSLY